MYKILFVDDDVAIHLLFSRISTERLQISCCSSGGDALEALKADGPFHVIVSDYQMPEMDGVEFLTRAKDVSPSSVRILLSGNADLAMAIDAVNECGVFRILTKPCSLKILKKSLRDALEYHRLSNVENHMSSKMTRGVIRMVSDIAAMHNPGLNSRTARILPLVKSLSRKLGDPDSWSTEVAAVLSSIGFIFLPDRLLEMIETGDVFGSVDYSIYTQHTEYSAKILSKLPYFEDVCTKLSLQESHYMDDGEDGGFFNDEIPIGSRILKVVSDFDRLKAGGRGAGEALAMMNLRGKRYDPKVIKELGNLLGAEARYHVREVYPLGLAEGMELAEDVYGIVKGKKMKFLSKRQVLDSKIIDYIHRNAENIIDITKKISIRERNVF
ncbi:HD domain-containing phosphohydrolase [Maridesulfovibrio salexigens]|uniref:Response regulator receiver protein n=1 Tax=Maridesulfovibrio salexigens (strain ATCC 14822 / DSM 2638 / NCIMB 8403 / VKM B-1763) TaxID=526222 RepID=C6BRZ3_MARSD|nr:HD domain-containing phosphohydrolase [Maridesulfovibrio salexigens]ACS81376.1 response regulator receiver protein [Maridesulfovibrio salexigens DSM 2638]